MDLSLKGYAVATVPFFYHSLMTFPERAGNTSIVCDWNYMYSIVVHVTTGISVPQA